MGVICFFYILLSSLWIRDPDHYTNEALANTIATKYLSGIPIIGFRKDGVFSEMFTFIPTPQTIPFEDLTNRENPLLRTNTIYICLCIYHTIEYFTSCSRNPGGTMSCVVCVWRAVKFKAHMSQKRALNTWKPEYLPTFLKNIKNVTELRASVMLLNYEHKDHVRYLRHDVQVMSQHENLPTWHYREMFNYTYLIVFLKHNILEIGKGLKYLSFS